MVNSTEKENGALSFRPLVFGLWPLDFGLRVFPCLQEGRIMRRAQSSKFKIDSPKTTPAILVVPTNHNFRCMHVAPPGFKIFTPDVMRGRRHQMIENNCMLFAPAKLRNRTQVVVIEKMLRECRAC